ncbi:NAD(P)/FAD-dependent oxidoreductase, partial [Okeania sp. SIO2B9]|uniref:FAD-dependent oxidoreductase n=1 Tax=Okeania sp. SIO2B9 TaxID=2607782 RepID=UPI00142B83C8
MNNSPVNNNLPSEIDVAIIGSGPAGTATAIALQQRASLRVAILERSAQNTFRIGETVPPNIRSPLGELGVLDILET